MVTDKPEWKQKAEEFLQSHLGDDNYNAEEAAVYFLSRGINTPAVSDTINKAINRWKNDETRWSYECRRNPTGASSTLKLMQWGNIGALQQYRDSIFQNFGVPYSHDFYPDSQRSGGYNSRTSAYFPLLFPLFTSDIAVKHMSSKLISLLHQWQNHLNDLFMRKELYGHTIDEEKSPNQSYATLISAYIYGAYRLGQVGINHEILSKSIQYLLDHQQESGLWAYDQTLPDSEEDDCVGEFLNSRNHTILASMGIHALSLTTNTFGAGSSTEKAARWLLQHQHSDGGWYQHDKPKYDHSVHTTVMALDAIELGYGKKQVTFVKPEKEGVINGKNDDSSLLVKKDNITINTSGDILLKFAEGDGKGLSIADDIKKKLLDFKNELLKDNPINLYLYTEFQKYESEISVNHKAKRPSYRGLAEMLYQKRITSVTYSPQTIKGWVKKLVEAGLIFDYYKELKRASRERATDPDILDNGTQEDIDQ